jgi:hypothetical protein
MCVCLVGAGVCGVWWVQMCMVAWVQCVCDG